MKNNLIGKFVKVLVHINKDFKDIEFLENEIAIIKKTFDEQLYNWGTWNCQIESIEGKRIAVGNLIDIKKFGMFTTYDHFKLVEEEEQKICEILYGDNDEL